MSVLALILARGGSKGILRKNIKNLCGKPLIAWSIEVAENTDSVDKVVVSTDDEEIAKIAKLYGADVPFLRPAELAQDDTPSIDPVLHALKQLPRFEMILLLQPTSPLRKTTDIDGILKLCQESKAPAAVSICESSKHPNWMFSLGNDGTLSPFTDTTLATRRQDLDKIYTLNGSLYLAKTDWIQYNRSFLSPETVGFEMPPERSADIDTLLDWDLVELLIHRDIL
jgi:CMP-N,N'-diacetyllegionaminic acid synthase